MSETFEKWGRKYCERSEWISIDRYWIEEAWDHQQDKIDVLEKELQAEREKSKQQFDLGYKHGVREGRGSKRKGSAR